jgi:hypothetical protein
MIDLNSIEPVSVSFLFTAACDRAFVSEPMNLRPGTVLGHELSEWAA